MPTADAPADLPDRVRTVLETADEPLTVGTIQRRVAADGLDVATSALRAVCRDLADAGVAVREGGDGDPVRYRIAPDPP